MGFFIPGFFVASSDMKALLDGQAKTNTLLDQLVKGQGHMSTALAALQSQQAALTASVAQNTNVIGSALTAFTGLASQIGNLSAQLQAAIAAGQNEDPAIQAVADGLKSLQTSVDGNTTTLAAAIVAGTSAASEPAGQPSPPVITPPANT